MKNRFEGLPEWEELPDEIVKMTCPECERTDTQYADCILWECRCGAIHIPVGYDTSEN